MSIKDDFLARFSEFEDSADLDAVLSSWDCYYPKAYADCNKEIILNLIAHLLVFETSQGSGSIKSEASRSVDGVSVSFGSATKTGNNRDFFGFTKYGQRFLFLASARNAKAIFV